MKTTVVPCIRNRVLGEKDLGHHHCLVSLKYYPHSKTRHAVKFSVIPILERENNLPTDCGAVPCNWTRERFAMKHDQSHKIGGKIVQVFKSDQSRHHHGTVRAPVHRVSQLDLLLLLLTHVSWEEGT